MCAKWRFHSSGLEQGGGKKSSKSKTIRKKVEALLLMNESVFQCFSPTYYFAGFSFVIVIWLNMTWPFLLKQIQTTLKIQIWVSNPSPRASSGNCRGSCLEKLRIQGLSLFSLAPSAIPTAKCKLLVYTQLVRSVVDSSEEAAHVLICLHLLAISFWMQFQS